MAEAPQQYHSHREVVTLARYLARNAVKARWRAEGRKRWDYSQKELAEAADHYLSEHLDLIGQAKATVAAWDEEP